MKTFSELPVDLQASALSPEGVDCPCCGKYLKVYQRVITGAMVYALILMDTQQGQWIQVPRFLSRRAAGTVVVRGGDYAKLRYWRFIETRPGKRDDGSVRIGWWKVTREGSLFVRNAIRVPRFAPEFAEGLIGEVHGPLVGVRDCIGAAFDYAAILEEVATPGGNPKALADFLARLRS